MYRTLSRDFKIIQDKVELNPEGNLVLNKIKKSLISNFTFSKYWTHIEHTSANPTGLLQSANIMQSLCGDTLCRFNESVGVYYVNDIGLNFFTLYYLIKKKHNIISRDIITPSLLDQTYRILSEDETLKVKELRHKAHRDLKLSEEQELVRDCVLDLIKDQLKSLHVGAQKFIYESDYLRATYQYMEQKTLDSGGHYARDAEGFFYKNDFKKFRLTTGDGVALYNFTDCLYRLDISKNSPRSVIVLGPGNVKGNQEVEEITNCNWALLKCPSVVYQQKKLSKRNKINFTYEQILDEIKIEDPCLKQDIVRLWCFNRINDSLIDLKDLKQETNIIYFRRILECNFDPELLNKINCPSWDELSISEKELLTLWADLEQVISIINKTLNLNKVVKLFERFYALKLKIKNIWVMTVHNMLLSKLKKKIGFQSR